MNEGQAAPAAGHAREYLGTFAALSAITVLEVGVAHLVGHRSTALLALYGLAAVKASCVGLFFMHLRSESRALRRIVAAPLALPVLYAVVLIADSVWRRLG